MKGKKGEDIFNLLFIILENFRAQQIGVCTVYDEFGQDTQQMNTEQSFK